MILSKEEKSYFTAYLIEWMTNFIKDPNKVIIDSDLGLCFNASSALHIDFDPMRFGCFLHEYVKRMKDKGIIEESTYPINDKSTGIPSPQQYHKLHKYLGEQLRLRKEFAKALIKELKEDTLAEEYGNV